MKIPFIGVLLSFLRYNYLNMTDLKNKISLVFLLGFVFILLVLPVLWLFQPSLIRVSGVSWQYNTIFLLLVLGISVFAVSLVFALKFWAKKQNLWIILFSAYGLPLLAIVLITLWVNIMQPQDAVILFNANLFRPTWQPLYYVWQSVFLLTAGFVFFGKNLVPAEQLNFGAILRGFLTGLGFGLCGAFLSSIVINTSSFLPLNLDLPQPPGILLWVLFVFSITITPYAAQRFYRTVLEPDWTTRFANKFPMVLVAVFFAVVQVGILNFPIAFTGSLLFSALYRRQQLWAAVVAHASCNAVLFLVGWYLVF